MFASVFLFGIKYICGQTQLSESSKNSLQHSSETNWNSKFDLPFQNLTSWSPSPRKNQRIEKSQLVAFGWASHT